jgi:hypothetical protein
MRQRVLGETKQRAAMPGGTPAMITLQDCIDMCGLTKEEVLAIAEHEHIPEIAAAALGDYLLHQEHGAETIRDMLRDDIRAALANGDRSHARELLMALRHFLSDHPEAWISTSAQLGLPIRR